MLVDWTVLWLFKKVFLSFFCWICYYHYWLTESVESCFMVLIYWNYVNLSLKHSYSLKLFLQITFKYHLFYSTWTAIENKRQILGIIPFNFCVPWRVRLSVNINIPVIDYMLFLKWGKSCIINLFTLMHVGQFLAQGLSLCTPDFN